MASAAIRWRMSSPSRCPIEDFARGENAKPNGLPVLSTGSNSVSYATSTLAPRSAVPTSARNPANSSRPMPKCSLRRSSTAGVREKNSRSSPRKVSVPASAVEADHVAVADLCDRAAVDGLGRHVDGGGHLARGAGHAAVGQQRDLVAAVLQHAERPASACGARACRPPCGPWKRTTAMTSPVSSPALKASCRPCWRVEDAGRGLDDAGAAA